MTDGQWLYMITNMMLDDEEQYDKLCGKCKHDSKQVKCPGCGKSKVDEDVNPNFDDEHFEKLKKMSVVRTDEQ
jgi:hypothetical protein